MNYRVKNVLVGCLIALALGVIVTMVTAAYIGQEQDRAECVRRGGEPHMVGKGGQILCLKPDSVIHVPGDVHG